MFKEDALFNITISNIKKNKKLYRNVFFTICFSFIVIILTNIVSTSLTELTVKQKQQVFGNWTMISHTITDEMKNDEHITIIGQINIIDNNLGSYDSNMFEIENYLIEGNIPKNNQEIVIEKTKLANLGYKQQLNQIITYNNQKYKLVGIMDDISMIWDIDIPTMITVNQSTDNIDYFIVSDDILYCLNQYADDNTVYNDKFEKIYQSVDVDNNDNIVFNINNSNNLWLQNMVIPMSLLGVLSCLLLINYKRKKQVILLKSIGTTNNQLIKIMFYECMILLIPAFIIGIFISFIISYIVMMLFTKQSHLSMIYVVNYKSVLLQIFIMLLSIIFMYCLAYIQIFKITIDGNVKEGKKKLKKYHKARNFNMVSYSLHRIIKNYKTHIIIILCLLMFQYQIMNVYSSYNDYKTNLQYLNDYKQYDYYIDLYNNGVDKEEILKYFNKDSVSYNQNDLYNDNTIYMEANKINVRNSVIEEFFSSNYRMPVINIDNNDYQRNQIEKSLAVGRMPENDYETVAYIPYTIDTSLIKNKSYLDLTLGQTIYYGENQTPLTIVGIVYDRLTVGYDLSSQVSIISEDELHYEFIVNSSTYEKLNDNKYNRIYISGKDDTTKVAVQSFINKHSDCKLIVNDNYISLHEQQYLQELYINGIINGSLCILTLYLLVMILKNTQYEYDKEYNTLRLLGAIKQQLVTINIIEILLMSLAIIIYVIESYYITGYFCSSLDKFLPTIIITIINIIILIIIQIRCALPHLNNHMNTYIH